MKKFLVEPKSLWPPTGPTSPVVVEQTQLGQQYSNDDSQSAVVQVKTATWQITGSWITISDATGQSQRLPGEQVIQQLVKQNQELQTQITQLQQEHREIMSRLSQVSHRIRGTS